jgi:signal transduction histidine kinase
VLRNRPISIPIILGVLSLGLSIALLVGWILVIVQNFAVTQETAQNTWLLVLGSFSFAVIITVLVLFSVFLVREIRVVNRQTRFIDSVTHELKSPLASLKLCLDTLERGDLASAQRSGVQRMMTDDVERLSILIDHVLQANRLSHGGDTHSLEEVALAELMETCAEGILRYHKEESGAIRIRVPRDLTIVTDRTALETVIKNLLDNAVKYSSGLDRPVEVTVDARLDGRDVKIEIRDRGAGIPKKHLKRVFERFYRVPDVEVRARHGTGLGLYVASILVRLLSGKLSVHSDGVGSGTLLCLRIPARSRSEPRRAGDRVLGGSRQ